MESNNSILFLKKNIYFTEGVIIKLFAQNIIFFMTSIRAVNEPSIKSFGLFI